MRITWDTFTLQLCQDLADQDVCNTFKTRKQHDKDAEKIEGEEEVTEVEIVIDDDDCLGEMGAKHTVLNEEQAAFADWINDNLKNDKDVEHQLPLSVIPDNVSDQYVTWSLPQEAGGDLYEKMDDGIILCKMVNMAAPDTIDERVINTGKNISIFKVNIMILCNITIIYPV